MQLQRFNPSTDQRPHLLNDLERGALAMARGGARQQGADRIDGLTVAPDDPAHVALAQLDPEDRCFSLRDLRKHHLVGEFDQLANNELEELFHETESIRPSRFVTLWRIVPRGCGTRFTYSFK